MLGSFSNVFENSLTYRSRILLERKIDMAFPQLSLLSLYMAAPSHLGCAYRGATSLYVNEPEHAGCSAASAAAGGHLAFGDAWTTGPALCPSGGAVW